jgi:pimeloyl-ACP methyl ester carboxylesterase
MQLKTILKLQIAMLCMALMLASCSKDAFNTDSSANDLFHVKSGDYLVPVLVRGNTAGKKIILYIQGGPGIASLDFAKIDYPGWKNTLEKEFAVAYYDQRGTGNKQGNFSQGESTMTTWVEDLHKTAMFLQKAYGAEIIMMGHSFGGSLMYRYMVAKGDSGIPKKYISISAPVTTDSDADTLRWQFRRQFLFNTANLEISREKRVDKWKEVLQWLNTTPVIKKITGPNPYRLMDQWNEYVENLVYVDYPEKAVVVKDYAKVIFSSNYNPLARLLNGAYTDEVASQLLSEEEADVLLDKLPLIKQQNVLILTGRYDDICPPEELFYIFNRLTTKQKKMEIIDYSGHEPFVNQPSTFYKTIQNFIE